MAKPPLHELGTQAAGDRERVVEAGNGGEDRDQVDQDALYEREPGVGIGRGEHYHENENDLKQRGRFAEEAWRKRAVAGNEQDDGGDGEDQNVAAQDHDGKPPGNLFFHGENHERRREQKLVGDRVEISADGRFLIELASEQAVKGVGTAREYQHQQGVAVAFVNNEDEEKGQDAQAEQRDLVGDRPEATFHFHKE